MPALYVNDTDLNSLGFKVRRVDGLGNRPVSRQPKASVGGRHGSLVLTSKGAPIDQRIVTVTASIRPRAGTTSLATLERAMENLYALAGQGLCELRDWRDTTKMAIGLLETSDEVPFDPQYLEQDPASAITLRFICDEPTRFTKAGLPIGLDTVRTAIDLGNAPGAPVIEIMGACTNPQIIVRDGAGTMRYTMGFTVTLAAEDFLRVDCDALVITLSDDAVLSDGYGLWTTKTTGPLILDPADQPTVELSASSGTPTGILYHRKVWQ